jgi:hypothetical protein
MAVRPRWFHGEKNRENAVTKNLGPEFDRLRKMTDEEVCRYIGGFNDREGLKHRLIGQHELQRRLQRAEAIRSWIAIIISVVALVMTLAQLLFEN